jgi:hypothetical protein
MTPLSRLTLAAANSCRTISSSPWQSATLGENGRRSAKPANLGSEPKKVTNPPKIPNEPSNSLKTHESTGFVFSFPTPDRRALPHQPPNLVHFLVRHRDSPLRPVAPIRTPSRKPWIMMSPPASRLPRARHVRRIQVRNMQRQMVLAPRLPPVDGVPPRRLPPQRDPFRPRPARPTPHHHFALFSCPPSPNYPPATPAIPMNPITCMTRNLRPKNL